jgi:hypothetical protein
MDDLTDTDHTLYNELDHHVMEMCYQKPSPARCHIVVNTRPATVAEVTDLAASNNRTVDEYLHVTCMATYREGGSRGDAGYPSEWPRVPRTQEDPVVRDRRTKIKQELLSMVVEVLGENSPGPALHARQLGWSDLPQHGPGTLCAYLLKRLGLLWGVINAPVQDDLRKGPAVILKDVRNTYLTILLSPPVGPLVVRNLLDALWPHIQSFDWVTECGLSYTSEVEWLESVAATE